MRTRTLLTVSLGVAAILAQAGCSRNRELDPDAAASANTVDARKSSDGATRVEKSRATTALPEGAQLAVRTASTLSTNGQEAGQTFTAYLTQPLTQNGQEIVPQGAEVEGRIVDADKGGRVKDRASISVQLTRLHTASGAIDISTSTITREAKATKTKDAAKIGIGSGIGAALGAVFGGGKGAAIGAAAGAGAGTGVVLTTHGDPAVIPSETVLLFTLKAPVTLARSE
jgi:hypothetical protein